MPRFTKETAAIAGKLGNIARWSPKPPQPDPEPELEPASPVPDEFHAKRLVRVRKQWESLDRMIEEETEPAKLDRLIAALARIEEIERRLSSRSLPPTLRSTDKRSNRRPGSSQATQPVVPSVPKAEAAPAQSTPPVGTAPGH